MPITRRELLRSSAFASMGAALAAGSIDTVFGASPAFAADAASAGKVPGYGPLVPDPAKLLDLPDGFTYKVVTRAGDAMADTTTLVPGRQDGSATFPAPGGRTFLINNHEQGQAELFPVAAGPRLTYDPGAQGGTTTSIVEKDGTLVRQYVSLAGTISNCAGGITPWGTWLTCEETEQKADPAKGLTKDHGFVFEVVPDTRSDNRDPQPITGLGRFAHEAVAIDERTGHVYLTEDASNPNGLFYRFIPNQRRKLLAGGTLEAMYSPGTPDLSAVTTVGTELPVEWKAIADPLAATTSIRKQFDHGTTTGTPGGAITRSRKLVGMWWGDETQRIYFVCSYARTSDGSAVPHDGQVWSLDGKRNRIRLEVRFGVNPDYASDNPDGPDNITVSPHGGLILAEDGEGVQHLLGVSKKGETFLFARNALNDSEFTGPTFSPDGKTLFANIQDPGIVLAIRGPWRQG